MNGIIDANKHHIVPTLFTSKYLKYDIIKEINNNPTFKYLCFSNP